MDDVRDEFGNPISLTDDRGNPVRLTDEHGNPMHLHGVAFHQGAGVAVKETKVETKTAGDVGGHVYGGVGQHGGATGVLERERKEERRVEKLDRSSSSSSSSSEDDGQGGRRKKKGIKEKIKEKLHVGKHEEKQAQYPTTVTSGTRPGEHHVEQEHEKKGVIEKIKEKLPGHH